MTRSRSSDGRSFFAELKQRHVVRAALIYAAAVWALAQGISQLSPVFGLSEKVTLWFVIACVIGFPFWLAFAWYFKFTARGIERESEAEKDEAAVRSTGRKLDYWIIGILAVAVVLLLTNQLVLQRGKTLREFASATGAPAAASAITRAAFDPPSGTIVVLPFANQSNDPQQRYFSNGITEELTGAIGQNTGLTVIAWDTASRFAGSRQTPAEIGKALNVAHILAGSIQREGDEVRVSAELVSTVTGQELWSAHYDDSLKNIFAVQDRITGAIAGALKVKFAGMQDAPTSNPQAHELYLKGLSAVDRQTAADAQTAQRYFQAALALDPNYADAWAGLANTYMQLTEYSTLPIKVAATKIRAAARKALALEPYDANALVVLGIADYFDGRIAQAQKDFQQALAMDPNNVRAHLDYALTLPLRDALAQTREAARLDPDNVTALGNLVDAYRDLSDWPHVVSAAQEMIGLSPHNVLAALNLAQAYAEMGRKEDAVKAFGLVQPETELDRQLLAAGELTYQAVLQPTLHTKALAALDELRHANLSPNAQVDLIQLYLALGKKETPLAMLPGTCAAEPSLCEDLAINPTLASLRGDPRFEKLAKQYTTETSGVAPASVHASAPAFASSR